MFFFSHNKYSFFSISSHKLKTSLAFTTENDVTSVCIYCRENEHGDSDERHYWISHVFRRSSKKIANFQIQRIEIFLRDLQQ